jgi:flagellar motility protein MotE (MotC chaperone)
MKGFARIFRLLPAVILVGTAVLTLKGEGLVKSAWAQDQSSTQSDPTVLAQDTAPLPKDIADDSAQSDSPAEVDVLTSLSKRRAELDAREADLNMRADELAAAESRVDGKIATLKQLQDQITTLLAQRDAEQQKQVAALVKAYGPDSMKAASAAAIFDTLPDEVLIPVAQAMKPDVLGAILAKMNPDAAQKLTVKLADRLALPQLAAPAMASATPPAANGQQTASATPQAAAPQGGAPAGK